MNSSIHVKDQKICLTMDPETQAFSGYTELLLERGTEFNPRVIFLNARQMKIEKVQIDKEDAVFEYFDTHEALEMKIGPNGLLIRDSSHFSRVCKDVLNSPELIIPLNRDLPVTLTIFYKVNKDSTAIVNRGDGIIYTNNELDGPSAWFPCIDGLGQRTRFTLDITYPKSLVCVGPGKDNLISTDETANTNTLRYVIPFNVQPKAIGFALGDFKQASSMNKNDQSIQYYFKRTDESFSHTVSPYPELLEEVTNHFIDQDMFNVLSSLSIVYVPTLQEMHLFPGLIFYPSNYVVSDGNSAVWIKIIPKIYESIIGQLVYFGFPFTDPVDEWIQHGIVRYFADYFCGASHRYKTSFTMERRWNEMNYLAAEDIHPSVVLAEIDPATGYPFTDEYLRIKAKLLINMVALAMNNNDSQQMLLLLLRQHFKQSLESFNGFKAKFNTMMSRFGHLINMKTFSKQWLESNGIPFFTFNFYSDVRNRVCKFVLYQTPSCKTTKIPFFTGHILVQLRDLEQPHEFQFPVENQLIQQQMKYYAHKPKKKTIRYYFVNGDTKEVRIYHSILWISVDPNHQWPMRVRPRLPEFMLHNMLDLFRDVYTEHEVLSSLEEWIETKETQDKLKELLVNEDCFYGVRGHAARTLALFANVENGSNTNVATLMDWYKSQFIIADEDKPKPNDFQNLAKHFVQLEVIKALSVVRNSQNYTPDEIVKLLIKILDENNNNGNQYSDDNFRVEAALALGRVYSDNDKLNIDIERLLVNRVRGSNTSGGFCNHLFSAFYTAITAVLLKKWMAMRNVTDNISSEDHKLTVDEMRHIIFDDSPYIECKATLFKCLLFFALINYVVTYPQLFSDIKKLAEDPKKKEVAAACLREVYRFILNTLPYSAKDKFECFLLFRPDSIKKEDVVKKMTTGEEALEVAETLWYIMTVCARNHSKLRSEALRAYTTLYGKDTPAPFFQRSVNKPTEFSATPGYNKTSIKIELKKPKDPATENSQPPRTGQEPTFAKPPASQ